MSENDDKLQKLLQLKNYESPGQEYFDQFLDDFQQRQKGDASKLTISDLFKERTAIWFGELGPSKWAVPAGSMAALALVALFWGSRDQPIVENKPVVNDSDPSKFETQVLELKLPSSSPPPESTFKRNKGVLPVQY